LWGVNSGTAGAKGVMFKVTAKRDISVKSFEFYTYNVKNANITVYTRVGDYIGHEFNSTGWDNIHHAFITYMGQSTLTKSGNFGSPVQIPEASIQSFYIVSNNYIMYNSGTSEGAVLTQDESLYLHEGEVVTTFCVRT
jgi:hypothetical protein